MTMSASNPYISSLNTPLLTLEDEARLSSQAQDENNPEAQNAKNAMVEANLRLVVYLAKKYRPRARKLGFDFMALIQEGNIGLMRAVDTYDASRGYRFATYASYWIRLHISRAMQNKAATIRVPVHMQEIVSKLRQAVKLMSEGGDSEPSPIEVADFLGLPQDKVVAAFRYINPTLSLDMPVGGEDSKSTLGDIINDTKGNLEAKVEKAATRSLVWTILRTLTPREEKVLRLRFGT